MFPSPIFLQALGGEIFEAEVQGSEGPWDGENNRAKHLKVGDLLPAESEPDAAKWLRNGAICSLFAGTIY